MRTSFVNNMYPTGMLNMTKINSLHTQKNLRLKQNIQQKKSRRPQNYVAGLLPQLTANS